MQRRLWQILAVLLAFTLVAAACGDDDESSDSGSDSASEAAADTATATETVQLN